MCKAQTRKHRPDESLQFAPLEPRNLFAADAFQTVHLAAFQSPTPVTAFMSAATQNGWDDSYEDNDTRQTAYNFGNLNGPLTVSGLRMYDHSDWYRFRQPGQGTASSEVRINFLHWQGDLDMALFDANGNLLQSSNGVQNSERISLNNRPAGTYFVRVYGYQGVFNPSYSLSINPGRAVLDDAYEDNDTLATAFNLGTLTTPRTISGLRMADNADWFRFRQLGTGNSSDFVRINFQHAQGDLDMALYNSAGQLIRRSDGVSNSERISLNGLPAGDYFIRIFGYGGAHNPNYSLTIDPASQSVTNRILYLNFDGANMTAADMRRWGGSDWNPAHFLDTNNNGTRVQPLFQWRADREQIIQGIIANVQSDLSPYGITVRRHFGLAVENVRATTIFIGPSDLGNGLFHVACDVDYGNNNRTDIAFVGEENWGTAARTILALSDVVLHEAGHTYGLFHVNSQQGGWLYSESMGLRYSTSNTENWVRETSFLNRTFTEYQNHGGGRGSQNSHLVMLSSFGLAAPALPQSTMAWTPLNGVFHVTGSNNQDRIHLRALPGGGVELNLNGQLHTLGAGFQEFVFHAQGDRSDRVTVTGNPGIRVRVERNSDGMQIFMAKLSAAERAVWNGTAQHRSPTASPCGCPACTGGIALSVTPDAIVSEPIRVADVALAFSRMESEILRRGNPSMSEVAAQRIIADDTRNLGLRFDANHVNYVQSFYDPGRDQAFSKFGSAHSHHTQVRSSELVRLTGWNEVDLAFADEFVNGLLLGESV